MKKTNEFPSGWDERRVREVLEFYENQTDEEAEAEHEAALSSPEYTVMEVAAKRLEFEEAATLRDKLKELAP